MKKLKIICVLLFLCFKSSAQMDFNKSIISENSIVKCSKYLVLPKTDSGDRNSNDSILQSEFFFDGRGNLIRYFSPDGAVASSSDSKDLKEIYYYKNDKIVNMIRIGFDSISVEYLYFEKSNMTYKINTDDKNERIGLELIYNHLNKEVKKVKLDFRNTNELNGYAYFYLSNIVYTKKTKKISISRKLVSITTEQLNLFKTSTNTELIITKLIEIEKGNFLDEVNFKTSFIYNNQKQLIKETSNGSTIEYFYNKKGLLISSIDKNKKYSFKSNYIYYDNIGNVLN